MKIDPENFKNMDFIEYVAHERQQVIKFINFIKQQSVSTTRYFLTFNAIYLPVYAYCSIQPTKFNNILMIFIFFLISMAISILLANRINTYRRYTAANFTIIREYQKHLYSRLLSDETINMPRPTKHSMFFTITKAGTWLPTFFFLGIWQFLFTT